MSEKRLYGRLVQKHDTEINWNKATTFVPLKGELIIYDIEVDAEGNTLTLPDGRTTPYTYERFKIGDGITNVNDLPFFEATYTLTEADKQIIVNAVIAALPNGDEVFY